MDENTVKTLTLIGTAILGVILGTFKEEIKKMLSFSRKYKTYIGRWSCSWKESPSAANPQGKTTFDMLEITSVRGKYIRGKGDGKAVGNWSFHGEISEKTITFLYRVEKGSDKSGVIILARDEDNEKKLEGAWCQYR